MREFGALRRSLRHVNAHHKTHHHSHLTGLLACVSAAIMVSACHAHAPRPEQHVQAKTVPKPSAHLLAKATAPVCLYSEAAAEGQKATSIVQKAVATSSELQSVTMASTDDALQRRERERDCFRDAEARVRKQLSRLQAAVQNAQRAAEQEGTPTAR